MNSITKKIKSNVTKKTLKLIFMLLGISIFSQDCLSQGSVDIEYFPINSVNQSFIGKEIRIDFKSANNVNVPTSILTRDTFTLKIKNDSIKFIEKWLMYADEVLLREQSFRSRDLNNAIQIYELILEHIDAASITVSATIYDMDSTYIEMDKKIEIIKKNINTINKEIGFLNNQKPDAKVKELENNKRGFEREIKKLEIQERRIDLDWIKKKNKKYRVERIVIDKLIIDGIMTKIK
jgi:hypothetical protein